MNLISVTRPQLPLFENGISTSNSPVHLNQNKNGRLIYQHGMSLCDDGEVLD